MMIMGVMRCRHCMCTVINCGQGYHMCNDNESDEVQMGTPYDTVQCGKTISYHRLSHEVGLSESLILRLWCSHMIVLHIGL